MYLMNYNFMTDGDVIDPIASKISVVNGVQLSNAIIDHYNLLNTGSYLYNETIPEDWTNTTVMNADFKGNINAGSISYSTDELKGMRIKRRIKGTFEWLTLYDIETSNVEDLVFTKYDLLNQSGVTYEYALVPYLNDGTECSYIIKEVESSLDGVFVLSPKAMVKFYGGLNYATGSRANRTGVFEPLGSKYPVVVSNAETNYYKGSLNATALSYLQLMSDNSFDRISNTNYLRRIVDFMTDKSTKIIKDWNGNIWLSAIIEDVNSVYENSVGMGMADINFNFVEVGSAFNQNDLMQNGYINISFTPENNPIPEPGHTPENSPPPHEWTN